VTQQTQPENELEGDETGGMVEESVPRSADLPEEQPASEPGEQQPPEPTAAEMLQEINEHFGTLNRLSRAVEEMAQAATVREAHFEQLHREQQQMRSEEASRAFLPIFRDLVTLYDQLVAAAIDDFADAVVAILERYGVEIYHPARGEPFAPRLQRGLATVSTTDAEADKTIARVRRPGFLLDGRPLRTAEVEVYRIAKTEPVPPESPEHHNQQAEAE
jgi:molecular chaperone GrpE (heat shock protein)